jgi:hypothetical protein
MSNIENHFQWCLEAVDVWAEPLIWFRACPLPILTIRCIQLERLQPDKIIPFWIWTFSRVNIDPPLFSWWWIHLSRKGPCCLTRTQSLLSLSRRRNIILSPLSINGSVLTDFGQMTTGVITRLGSRSNLFIFFHQRHPGIIIQNHRERDTPFWLVRIIE